MRKIINTLKYGDKKVKRSLIIAIFMKVEWKPIPHNSTVTIEEIEKASEEMVVKK